VSECRHTRLELIEASLYLLARVASAFNSYIHLTLFEITLSVLQFNRSCLLGPFCLACQSTLLKLT